jgi:DNA mismatch repair protein MutS2
LQEIGARVAPAPAPAAASDRPLAAGMTVAAEHLGLKGELVAITGDYATVRAGTVTVRVPVGALRPVEPAPETGSNGRRPATPAAEPAKSRSIGRELLLLGKTSDEARELVEQYLDDAFMAGLANVRLIHGKGTGALRKAVRGLLSGHPLVESFRDGEPSEGGAGATVAVLKVG